LRTLHFDSLKIDQSFVRRLATDRETHAIVETIVNLAHALQMNVVAEGIETEDQLAELIDIGCESGQGFLFSRPVSSEAIDELLATRFAL
jgi:EAL domain-containing protein (putative c-di-GMP-specific phosphodiesterase class I)